MKPNEKPNIILLLWFSSQEYKTGKTTTNCLKYTALNLEKYSKKCNFPFPFQPWSSAYLLFFLFSSQYHPENYSEKSNQYLNQSATPFFLLGLSFKIFISPLLIKKNKKKNRAFTPIYLLWFFFSFVVTYNWYLVSTQSHSALNFIPPLAPPRH